MSHLSALLENRREEFDTHYMLAVALEARLFEGEDASLGETKLSARHLLTMKSGLIVHLYNVVEATLSRALVLIGAAMGEIPPQKWSESALREWLREHGVRRVNGGDDARLTTVHKLSRRLLEDKALGPQDLRKPPGSWTDEHVSTIAKRLGIEFIVPIEMKRRIEKSPEWGDKGALAFLADRRNALAHGSRSFEDGASDLTLARIRKLADITLDFVELAADSFQAYVDKKHYMAIVL